MKKNASFHYYNNGVKTIKVKVGKEVPEGFEAGRLNQYTVWNAGLTAESDERVKANGQATRLVRLEKDNYKAWNDGLTKETDERVARNVEASKLGMFKLHGVENPSQIPGIVKKNPVRKNVTIFFPGISSIPHIKVDRGLYELYYSQGWRVYDRQFYIINSEKHCMSVPEEEMYKDLVTEYGKDNVFRQYKCDRYPFNCDFYISSEDLFIELNAHWTHGFAPFDSTNMEHIKKLEMWKEKAKTSNYYKSAIKVWTEKDPLKQRIAKENNLNYIVIY